MSLKGVTTMPNKRFLIKLTIMTSVFLFVAISAAMAASVPRMTADELKMHLGEADYQVLDVRAGGDWASSSVKISGAERVEPRAVGQWVDNYDKEKTIVLYCA
jgi:hypothetical protein